MSKLGHSYWACRKKVSAYQMPKSLDILAKCPTLDIMEAMIKPERGGRMVPQWTVADRLRKAREITGMTQTDFGSLMYLTRKQVGNVETGVTKAGKELLIKWAMASNVDLEWLKTGEGSPDGPPPGALLPDLDSNQEPSG